ERTGAVERALRITEREVAPQNVVPVPAERGAKLLDGNVALLRLGSSWRQDDLLDGEGGDGQPQRQRQLGQLQRFRRLGLAGWRQRDMNLGRRQRLNRKPPAAPQFDTERQRLDCDGDPLGLGKGEPLNRETVLPTA